MSGGSEGREGRRGGGGGGGRVRTVHQVHFHVLAIGFCPLKDVGVHLVFPSSVLDFCQWPFTGSFVAAPCLRLQKDTKQNKKLYQHKTNCRIEFYSWLFYSSITRKTVPETYCPLCVVAGVLSVPLQIITLTLFTSYFKFCSAVPIGLFAALTSDPVEKIHSEIHTYMFPQQQQQHMQQVPTISCIFQLIKFFGNKSTCAAYCERNEQRPVNALTNTLTSSTQGSP